MHSYTYEQLYNNTTRILKEYVFDNIKHVVLLANTGIIKEDGTELILKVDIPFIKYLIKQEEHMLIDDTLIAQYILIKLTNLQLRNTG